MAGIVIDLLVEHFGDYVDLEFTAKMEEDLDEVASGKRAWVPLLEAFYGPLRDRVDEKRKSSKRKDFTTEASDEVCSLGHPMVIRLGPQRPLPRLLAVSRAQGDRGRCPATSRPRRRGPARPARSATSGTLVGKRGRFGPFVGCDRYPDCDYIRREGPPPPEQLPFEVICPKNGDGHLVARRARRTGNVFWGCSDYPKCDFTTNHEPIGAPTTPTAARSRDERRGATICLKCGAAMEVPPGIDPIGAQLPGGPPDPAAIAPARAREREWGIGPLGSGTPNRRPSRARARTRRAADPSVNAG